MQAFLSRLLLLLLMVAPASILLGQTVDVTVLATERQQVIDGFGAFQDGNLSRTDWVKNLYLDDLGASIYRVDLVPRFISPYSDLRVYSPWFMGSGTNSVFNFEDPDNPDGPEGNRVRTYTGPNDYSRDFGGENAPIAVMGPDIEFNKTYYTFSDNGIIEKGKADADQLGDFKLIGSLWSPAPWVKVSSGNSWRQNWFPGPVMGAEWPFVWGGNYGGGKLDVSGELLDVFDDSELGGDGPTSSLTQFARGLAAYLRGFQEYHGIRFYAISLQNELNFEQYYNSATYPLSQQYITALKIARAELDKYDDLRDIKIMGPEDLLGGDAYALWQFGGGDDVTHKNLQYLRDIAADPEAQQAIDFYCIHGYDSDGVSSADAVSTSWDWWANGWETSPASGIPADIPGFTGYGKKSWMTETSGENHRWLFPTDGYPSNGAWSVALRIHQALTTGQQSAWVYWTFVDADDNGNATDFGLTTEALQAESPKYVAAKHFFRHIRPDAYRVNTTSNSSGLFTSAYVNDRDGSLTLVLLNGADTPLSSRLSVEGLTLGTDQSFAAYTSSEGSYWQNSTVIANGQNLEVTVPAYGIVTLVTGELSTPVEDVSSLQNRLLLKTSVPHPVSKKATLAFQLPSAGMAQLTLHDLSGRLVTTLLNQHLPAGDHEAFFSAETLPAGTYLYTLRAGGESSSRKLVVVH